MRGGGRCQVEHERLSLCSSHYSDQHSGPWHTWQQCREFWTPQEYKAYAENPINEPKYETVGWVRGPNSGQENLVPAVIFRHPSVRQAKRQIKTLIVPSREAKKRHQAAVREAIRHASSHLAMASHVAPLVVGWRNYYRTVIAKESFKRQDDLMFWNVVAKLRYKGSKTKAAAVQKAKVLNQLLPKHADQKITRHIKVKGTKSPYDGDWAYWATRLGKSPDLSPRKAALLKRQQGRCGHCHLRLIMENLLEVHHVDGNHKNNRQGNLQLLHRHCHQELTRTMLHDKATHVEEPCAVKIASTVLKPSGGSDTFA